MVATVALDLTQAIALGAFLSGAIFLNQIASIRITLDRVDVAKLRGQGIPLATDCRDVRVAYIVGPLFFAAVGTFNEAFAHLEGVRYLVLSMRGVPLVDTSGLQALRHLHERLAASGGRLLLAAVHPEVETMLVRSGLPEAIGGEAVYASADQAIVAADRLVRGRDPQRGVA